MALILIRAMNKRKVLNTLADIERHAKLNIIDKPRIIGIDKVNKVTKRVIKQNPREDIKLAVLAKVQEDTTYTILKIRKIHPPAHIIVISEEYPEYESLNNSFSKLKILNGYYSYKDNDSKKRASAK